MIINKMPIKNNFSKRINKLEYIVVHDTGNPRKGAGAKNHYFYFDRKYRGASAHYFVDDSNIIELIDPHLVAWHCGDGKGRFGIRNDNSIGVEICINEDSDYEMACKQAIELIRFLMIYYNIPKQNIVRHYDASRKICPATMAANNWEKWKNFYKKV